MGIPTFDELGLLPVGVWDCTLDEIAGALCWNEHRRTLLAGFTNFLEDIYRPAALAVPLWIDGSFTRSKLMPEDIDVVIDLGSLEAGSALPEALRWRMRHSEIKARYHVDLWPRHPDLPRDLAAYFQYVGPKAAAELMLDEKHPKGILRMQP